MDDATTEKIARGLSPGARKLLVVAVICFVLAAVTVTLRLWARKIKGHRLCFNDYAILAALVGGPAMKPKNCQD